MTPADADQTNPADLDQALVLAAEATALHADPAVRQYDRGRKLGAELAEILIRWEPVLRAAKLWAVYGRDDSDDEEALLRAVRALEARR